MLLTHCMVTISPEVGVISSPPEQRRGLHAQQHQHDFVCPAREQPGRRGANLSHRDHLERKVGKAAEKHVPEIQHPKETAAE